MKKKVLPYLVILVVAILASYTISTWHVLNNVSACTLAPGCVDQGKQPIGKLTVQDYGFPAANKETATFNPANSNERASNYAGYASASAVIKSFSIIYLVIDVIFWSSLLYVCYSIALKIKSRS